MNERKTTDECIKDKLNSIEGKIKPCPFCGGKVEIFTIHKHMGEVTQLDVVCTICGAEITTRCSELRYWGSGLAEKSAIDKWNQRAKND